MSNGLILGEVPSRLSFWDGLAALCDRWVPADVAVRRYVRAGRKAQPSRLLRMPDSVIHKSIYIPTGFGKGQSLIFPFLDATQESFFLTDIKGEAARQFAARLERRGFETAVLDPYRLVTANPARLNPLDVAPADDAALDFARAAAIEMCPRAGREQDPFWADSAADMIAGLTAFACLFAEGGQRNLQTVRDLLADGDKRQRAFGIMAASPALGGVLARIGHALASHQDKQLASVIAHVHKNMSFLDVPAIAESTRDSTFDPTGLTRRRMAVFVVLPPSQIAAQAGWLRLVVGTLMRACVAGGLQERNRVHGVIDEAGQLGQMDILLTALTVYRAYGLRLQLYYQSLSQLRTCWPDGADGTVLSNTAQIYAAVNDLPTAESVSNRLGDFTEVMASGGTSRTYSGQYGSQSSSWSESTAVSDNWSLGARKLLQPAEVMQLDPRVAIVFVPGRRPVWARLIRYHEWSPAREVGFPRAALEAVCLAVAVAGLCWLGTLAVFFGK